LPTANFNVVAASLELGKVDRARAVRQQFDSLRPGHLIGSALQWLIGWSAADYVQLDSAVTRLEAEGGAATGALAVNGRLWLSGLRGQPSRMEAKLAESAARAGQGEQVAEYLRSLTWVATYQAVVEGRPADALKRVDAALARFPLASLGAVDRPYPELAAFYARAEQPARARALLAEYRREVPAELHKADRASVALAAGFASLAEKRTQDAIRDFQSADVGQCTTCALPGLARAWQEAGNQDSVVAVLERYVTIPDDDRQKTDPLERAGALARLGELHEQRGDTVRAVERNAQFLELWKNADPVFKPVIDRVRERQRKLTAEKP